MARLSLHFENRTLKEFPLTRGAITIGRLPDNSIQIDNPAVSGHHAKLYWSAGDFVIEDNDSLNGTFVNDERIQKHVLKDNDRILIGKHTLYFCAEPLKAVAPESTVLVHAPVPTLDGTAMLDTKKARELMAQASGKYTIQAGHAVPAGAAPAPAAEKIAPKLRVGVLTVISGDTDEKIYVLTGKLTVIGKSDMASIRLKGWFAPKIAAAINRHDDHYFIAPSDTRQNVKVNGSPVHGPAQLNAGDTLTVGKVSMTFDYD